jgi:NodT family efflux transporter outer membrane factor (OMF) lipoprotein
MRHIVPHRRTHPEHAAKAWTAEEDDTSCRTADRQDGASACRQHAAALPALTWRGLARRGLLAFSVSLALASCASFQGIHSDSKLRTPADYAASTSLAAPAGDWPGQDWTAQIGGAPLQALVDEALVNNPSLDTAAARIATARAQADIVGATTTPNIGARFSSTYQRFTENGLVPPALGGQYKSDNRLSLDFSYELDFWGRHAAELRAALSQGKAAEAEQVSARLMLTTAIARAWVQLARQHEQADLTAQQIAVRQKIDRLIQLRYKAGLDPRNDAEQARQQIANLRAEQAQWQEAMTLTRNQLAALLGKGPDRGQSIARPPLPAESAGSMPDDLPLNLLARRPDIVAARWRVEAAQGDIDTAKARFYPNVNLAAFAGFSSLGLPNLLNSGSTIVGFGPAIQLPVFEGGTLRAQLKGRVAAYDAAVASYNQTLTDAMREVADQAQSLRAAAIQGDHQREAVQAADSGLYLAQERERKGTANMLPVLAAELNALTQRKAALDAQARRADLRIGLIKALGGGFDAGRTGLAVAPAAGSPAALVSHSHAASH